MSDPETPGAAAPTDPEPTVTPADVRRRLRLRVIAKLLVLVALLASGWVLLGGLRSIGGEPREVRTQVVALPALAADQAHALTWEGRPVILVYRSEAVQRWLAEDPLRDALADPSSLSSRQPDWARSSTRSRVPGWFVAIAAGTDLGCPVRWIAPGERLPGWPLAGLDVPWPGGFADSCGQSLYDPAGRVYTGQSATRNLAVPAYRLDTDRVVLGAD